MEQSRDADSWCVICKPFADAERDIQRCFRVHFCLSPELERLRGSVFCNHCHR